MNSHAFPEDVLKSLVQQAKTWAATNQYEKLDGLLDRHSVIADRYAQSLLFDACARGHIESAALLVERYHASLTTVDERLGISAIDYAAQNHKWPMVEKLLDLAATQGVSIADGSDRETRHQQPTPYLLAARDGRPNIMKRLKEAGADVHYCDGSGEHVLFYATRAPHSQKTTMQEALIAAGDLLNAPNAQGRNPLDIAMAGHNKHAAALLHKAGARTAREPLGTDEEIDEPRPHRHYVRHGRNAFRSRHHRYDTSDSDIDSGYHSR